MRKERYTTTQLLEVIKSYYTMIQRSGRDFPAVVLDDIRCSTKGVLKANGIKEIRYIMNGEYENEIL